MRKCCICLHKNKRKADDSKRSLFHLPQKETIKNEWLKRIPERSKYLKKLMVCEIHFSKKDFQRQLAGYEDARKRLISTAVPKLHLGDGINPEEDTENPAIQNSPPILVSGRKSYTRKPQNKKSSQELSSRNECAESSDKTALDHNYYSSLKDEMQLETTKLVLPKALKVTPLKETPEFTSLMKKKNLCATEKYLLLEEAEPAPLCLEETFGHKSKTPGLERETVMKLDIISKLPLGWFEAVPTSFIRTFFEQKNVPGENIRLAIRSFKVNAEFTTFAEYVLDDPYRPPAQFSTEKDLYDAIERFVSLPLCSGVPNEQYENLPLTIVGLSFYGNAWHSKACRHIAAKGLVLCLSCQKLKTSLSSKPVCDPKQKKRCCEKETDYANDAIIENP